LTREEIRAELISLLKDSKEDWDDSMVITDDTGLFLDLGIESIELVGLGSVLDQRFGKVLPFPEFMSRAREEDLSDVTVGRLVDFLALNLDATPAAGGKVA
jgi:acyl carrier protein